VHPQRPLLDSSLYRSSQPPMVDRAQRVEPSRTLGNHGITLDLDQFAQQIDRQVGHVASDQQNPFGVTGLESCEQPSQWTAIRNHIGDHDQPQLAVSIVPDDHDVSDRFTNYLGDVLQQRPSLPGQQGFVATHAGTAAAGQHEPRVFHEKIVAMLGRNKKAAMCFGLALLALSPLHAETATSRKLVVRADKRTGRLVTVAVPTARPTSKAPSAPIAQMVADAARANNIDPLLVHSVIQVESNYNPNAVSSAGAQGLMQLMPGTARDLGVTDSFDPRQNIEAGVKYLKYLKDQYQDDKLALAAYNAGPGSVQKYKAVPPYPETRDYVKRVGERYVEARKAAGIAPAVALQPAVPQDLPQVPVVLVVPTEEKHARLEQFLDEYGRLHLRTAPE